MREPSHVAVGTWSGGVHMRFGERIEPGRLAALLRPDEAIPTLITADAYGTGAADELAGEATAGLAREDFCLVGMVGHDFYEGERAGAKGFPRFTDPGLRGPDGYADYLRRATEASLGRCGVQAFDVLLLHNPDRTGYESEEVWRAMAGLRDEGLAGRIGVAPGPANGFTLDLIQCFERFGSEIDWAMIILNPLEPWPGRLCLGAAEQEGISVVARVVDYGGLFWGDRRDEDFGERDHRAFRPDGWVAAGLERIERMAPVAERHGLTPLQLSGAWCLAHEPVRSIVPTLIQEPGPDARTIEDKRAELAATPYPSPLDQTEVAELATIGDNAGCMALKGASPQHEGDPVADRWTVSQDLADAGTRWGIDPNADLVQLDRARA